MLSAKPGISSFPSVPRVGLCDVGLLLTPLLDPRDPSLLNPTTLSTFRDRDSSDDVVCCDKSELIFDYTFLSRNNEGNGTKYGIPLKTGESSKEEDYKIMDSSSAGVRAKSAAISTLVQQLQRGEITKATMFARLSALKGNSGTNGATTNVDGNTASPSLNNSIRTTGNLSAYVGSTPSKADDARGDDVPRVVLSPSPVDSQVLSSPDRRQLIQQLLAEKRKVRDAAIKNANKFVGEQEGTGEQEEAREGERDGLGLSMMDLDTNAVDGSSGEEGGRDVGDSDEYNNPPPPPKQSQSGGYHNNLRAMMSGSGGDVGGGRRAAGVEMPHKKGQSQRQREQQQKQQKMVQQREKQRGEQQRSRPTTLQSLDTSPTPPPAQEPSFVNSRKASEEMKSRTLRAVNEEVRQREERRIGGSKDRILYSTIN